MSAALELVKAVEANGGRLAVEGKLLVVRPAKAGKPLAEQLRRHKPEIITLLRSLANQVASDSFGLWLLDRCVFRDNCLSGIAALHLDFALWCKSRGNSMYFSRWQFEQLLKAEGFLVDRVGSSIYGLLLVQDYEAALGSPAPGPGSCSGTASSI